MQKIAKCYSPHLEGEIAVKHKKKALLIDLIDLVDMYEAVGTQYEGICVYLSCLFQRKELLQPFIDIVGQMHEQIILAESMVGDLVTVQGKCSLLFFGFLLLLFQVEFFLIAFIGNKANIRNDLSNQVAGRAAPLSTWQLYRCIAVYTVSSVVIADTYAFARFVAKHIFRYQGSTSHVTLL